jgi:hypothetical protein
MIQFNTNVYIESGNGTVESVHAIADDGTGILFMNQTDEPYKIGEQRPLSKDFDPNESAITWRFKNIASLNVVIENLIRLREDMEAYARGELDEEMNNND